MKEQARTPAATQWDSLLCASFFSFFLVAASCKAIETDNYSRERGPAELKAIYSEKTGFLLQASSSSSLQSFEVCLLSKGLPQQRTIAAGSCVPAFVSSQGQPIKFSRAELQDQLTEEDKKLIKYLETSGVQALALGIQDSQLHEERLNIQAIIIEINRLGGQVTNTIEEKLSAALLSLFLIAGSIMSITSKGEAIMPIEKSSGGLLDPPQNKPANKTREEAAKHSSLIQNWQHILSTDDTNLVSVDSVFHLLYIMGRFFHHNMPTKDVRSYCFPSKRKDSEGLYRMNCQPL